ncbi:MAG: glycosyl hydrolase family 17 protein [Flavobacterium sp.]|uniref:glycosyl hydrolase family 17 protein n=1 Tax=Flavobacterium sp. TaxID=239 RepID=UPI002B46F248|nr:glycosyl hydrolase family 17 protein [Flavobacterium sp.]WRH73740.1 MAG: glycosyl hydrolase family 17 protein [Flavobacterium sp.]
MKIFVYIESTFKYVLIATVLCIVCSCKQVYNGSTQKKYNVTAKEILGNPNYLAICYGGYRKNSREIQPTVNQLKQDLLILAAMNIKIVRTYNVHLVHASNVLKAISELKKEDKNFEMYVMLGAWIDCKYAWTEQTPDHDLESQRNAIEINEAVRLANLYPEIVKVIAVGNEAMVKWATAYYVQPKVILKWVNYLQQLKKENKLSKDLWITSSDDFASWGGGDDSYKTKDLEDLINAVDYVSMHTYPYHNTHYNPSFWNVPHDENQLTEQEQVTKAMHRSIAFAKMQYATVKNYVRSINPSKPIHIGETGWASSSDSFYGKEGSRASDEYKQAIYYKAMREWTNSEGISCFFFEAFDEPWKDSNNPLGSENHFGIFTVDGKAKYAVWDKVEKNAFYGLKRDEKVIVKTYSGNKELLIQSVLAPPKKG